MQWADNGGTNQQFRVADTDSGFVKLINRKSAKPLDVVGWSTADGGRISQYADHGGANQQWQLVKVGAAPTTKYAGYLFTHFTGEGTANGEQVYFALSQGNDPTRWRQLNGGRPVLTSTVGNRGVRDPFIIRSPQGDRFFQISTDQRMYGDGDWDAAQRRGSKSILVWESTDLVNWSAPRVVRVSPDTAGNTWAPEAYYDEGLGKYVVFWASKIYAANDPNHTGNTYNRMMYATTSDFRTFSAAQVWVDKGYSTIDSTLIKHNGTYYRLTKDERSGSESACGKFILEEKSTTILNRNYSFVAECIGRGGISQGEGPLIFKSNTEERWYTFIDEYGGRGYVPFTTTDLNSGQWTRCLRATRCRAAPGTARCCPSPRRSTTGSCRSGAEPALSAAGSSADGVSPGGRPRSRCARDGGLGGRTPAAAPRCPDGRSAAPRKRRGPGHGRRPCLPPRPAVATRPRGTRRDAARRRHR